jgi:Fe-S-cluster containining protein
MHRLLFSVPQGQRYSCHQCGWCCRWWRIEVEPADRDRLLAHDWAADSPRLAGVQLFEEQQLPGRTEPVVQTAQIDGQCVFLEGDGLCLIHRVMGLEAKPAVCQGFPLVLGRTTDGVLVGGNYACPSLVRNDGDPFYRQEEFVLGLLERWEAESAEDGPAGRGAMIDTEPLLAEKIRLAWRAYRALEDSLLEILGKQELPASARLVAEHGLIGAATAHWAGADLVEESEAREWLEEWRAEGYERAFDRTRRIPRVPAMRVRAVLAPLIADVETAPLGSGGRHSAALGYAMAIVNGKGQMRLSTLRRTVYLGAVRRVVVDMDSPDFEEILTRFLSNFVVRKSLLESESLLQAGDDLCLYFALVRWYACAAAAADGRGEVGVADLVQGIQVVEKAYVHRMGMRSGFRKGLLATLLKLEMRYLVPPAALVMPRV